jgi:hypothetical protein
MRPLQFIGAVRARLDRESGGVTTVVLPRTRTYAGAHERREIGALAEHKPAEVRLRQGDREIGPVLDAIAGKPKIERKKTP